MRTPDGRDLRVVLKITRDEKGALSATMYALDQNGPPMAGSTVSFAGGTLRFVNVFPRLNYEGKMSADGNSISGSNAEWLLSAGTGARDPGDGVGDSSPPPLILPMDRDAKPSVEVATIKPTEPGTQLFMLTVRGEDLVVKNHPLTFVMKFAYPARPIVGFTGWMDTEKWDIEVKPDTPGMPSIDQIRDILQKLLVERFALKVHEEKREMPAYALTVGKDGPKMTKSVDASLWPALPFSRRGRCTHKAPRWRTSRACCRATFSASR